MTRLQFPRVPRMGLRILTRLLAVTSLSLTLTPTPSLACACGCGVFDVGTGKMMPTDVGGTVWLEYDFMDQNQNWSGMSSAPAGNNPDKRIATNFLTAGVQYMFSRSWGVEVEVPYWGRTFKTETDDPNPGDVQSFNHSALGDVRVKGVYTGFSDDMSTGITFGIKLASGDFTYEIFDRDTSIGTGSPICCSGPITWGRCRLTRRSIGSSTAR